MPLSKAKQREYMKRKREDERAFSHLYDHHSNAGVLKLYLEHRQRLLSADKASQIEDCHPISGV